MSIRQRHPHTFESAVQSVVEDDEELKQDIERLVLELAVVSLYISDVETPPR